MLGWHITLYRQANGGNCPAVFNAPTGATLAVWQANIDGSRWIDALVDEGLAVCLGGNGYPIEYTAKLKELKETILNGPPHANAVWRHDPGDILMEGWLGKTTIYHEAISGCPPGEWLLIQVWDES